MTASDEAPTHHQLARAYIEMLTRECSGVAPVFEGGRFWVCPNGIWRPVSLEQASVGIGANLSGTRNCRRKGDYAAIAQHAGHIVAEDDFFQRATWGLITPWGFWHFDANNELKCHTLTSEDRQRFKLPIDPDFDRPAPMWAYFLKTAFGKTGATDETDLDETARDQIKLLRQLIGAALFGSLWRYQVVALFIGRAQTGKSTLLTIIRSLFPRDSVCAVAPTHWGNEYYLAGLAGRRLNLVGDLTGDTPLPPGYFKQVTGRDPITGRHPTHRPFTFVCDAAHFFNGNQFPTTTDRSSAFFRRWRIVAFDNAIADDDIDEEFDQRIIAHELPGVLAWAIKGAQDLLRSGKLHISQTHRDMVERWKHRANSVLEFLLDEDVVELDETVKTSAVAVYDAYRVWASHVGRKNPFGRNEFYEQIDTSGAPHKVTRQRDSDGRWIKGVQLTATGLRYAGAA